MNTPFLKKYQPFFFKDYIINKEYTNLLNTLIDMDNLNILFVGNSGSGKTTLINSIMREYYKCSVIPKNNILTINNVRDQGIHYYRSEVKTFCQTPSIISKKKKFVIIDDIDFINEQSQQVFRNCIDKYSHNVHFLASCSNTQKVIENIQSRCVLIKIKPVSKNSLENIFTNIKKNENLKITATAKKFILNICNDSIRLLINYLEKFKLLDMEINEKIAKQICTNISFYSFEKFTKNWYIDKKLNDSIKNIYEIYKKGYSVMDILDSYFIFIKLTNILPEKIKYKTIKIILEYIALFNTLHEAEIELSFFTNDLFLLKKNV